MSKTYSLGRSNANLIGGLFDRTARGLWLTVTMVALSAFLGSDVLAQTLYYSKAAATDFNNPASWGTNTDGTGTSPSSITNADNYQISNGSAMTLTGNVSVRQLLISNGSLAVASNTLTVSKTGAFDTFLNCAGTNGLLNVSGTGSVVVNGSMRIGAGGKLTQSGGNISLDGNNAGNVTGSVASGTYILELSPTTNSDVNLTGGVFTVVDPHYTTTTTVYGNAPTTPGILFSGTHTFRFGDGVSSDPGGSNGFQFYSWGGTGIVRFQNLTIENGLGGTNRFVLCNGTYYNLGVAGNLTIQAGGEFRNTSITTGTSATGGNYIGGNIVNLGTYISTAPTQLGLVVAASLTSLTITPTTSTQTINGNGVFRNAISGFNANFPEFIVNNTSGTPVQFISANSLLSPGNSGTVGNTANGTAGVFTFTAGTINLGGNEIILGTSTATVTPTLNFTYGVHGFRNGTVSKFVLTGSGTLPTSISATPTSSSCWPFMVNGANRSVAIGAGTGPTTAGKISVTHTEAAGLTTLGSAVDGMDRVTNATWSINTNAVAGGANYLLRICGDGFVALTGLTNSPRILQGTNPTFAAVGTFAIGTGNNIASEANRTAIGNASFLGNNNYVLGYANADLAISSLQSGPWDDPATWSSNSVPTGTDAVNILSGHTVTINGSTPAASCLTLDIAGTGTLSISGSSLTVSPNGPATEGFVLRTLAAASTINLSGGVLNVGSSSATKNIAGFSSAGAFNLTGTGTLNVFGYMDVTGTFVQNGASSNVNIDGNKGGVAANSVTTANYLVRFNSNTVTLSAGTFTILDPHTAATNTLLFNPSTTSVNASLLHTFVFGNGASTEAGGTNGFRINQATAGVRLAFGQLTINTGNATVNGFVDVFATTGVLGDLTISTGEIRANAILYVNGSIVNNGILTTPTTLYLGNFASATAGASTVGQSISGTGTFRNAATSATANFGSLQFNNTSTAGIAFSGTAWNSFANATVLTTLTFTAGRVSLNGALTLGTAGATAGTLSYTAGGFTSGTFRRWFANSTALSGQATANLFPFVTASAGEVRHFYPAATLTSTGAGWIAVQYNDASGTTAVSIANEANVTVSVRSNSNWVTSQGGGLAITAGTGGFSARGDNLVPLATAGQARLVGASASIVGTSVPGSGTVANPVASKTTIADATSMGGVTIYFGAQKTINSAATGKWEDGTSWVGGAAPTAGDAVVILSTHNITVDATTGTAAAAALSINAGGTLTQSGGTLNIQTGTAFNSSLSLLGAMNMSAGNLNIFGSMAINNGASFTQSGGAITIDGNNGGSATNSVASGVNLFAVGTPTSWASGTFNVTGGSLTIVDPTIAAAGGFAVWASVGPAASIAFGGTHTLFVGNGVSTDAGNDIFRLDGFISTGRLVFNNIVINAGTAATREVRWGQTGQVVRGDFTLTSGRYNQLTHTVHFAKNITIGSGTNLAHFLGTTHVLSLQDWNVTGNAGAINPNTQVIRIAAGATASTTAAGFFNNTTVASATAHLGSVTINNNNATGVTINSSTINAITGVPAQGITIGGTLTFTAGRLSTVGTGGVILGQFSAGVPSAVGTLSYTSGGFTSGSTFGRSWLSTTTGSTVTANSDLVSVGGSLGRYPFLNASGVDRSAWLQRSGTVAGTAAVISCTYNDATSVSQVATPFTDATVSVNRRFDGNWSFAQSAATLTQTAMNVGVNATGAFGALGLSNNNARLMRATAAMPGANAVGATLPQAQRAWTASSGNTPLADLTSAPVYVGASSADVPIYTAQSGEWTTGSTWVGGNVPATTDFAVIAPTHTVTTVNGGGTVTGLTIQATGALNMTSATINVNGKFTNQGTYTNTGATLNVTGTAAGAGNGIDNAGVFTLNAGAVVNLNGGAGLFNRTFQANNAASQLNINGGDLNIRGNMAVLLGQFNQSGGNITIDPNNGGSTTGSVAAGTASLQIGTNQLNWTGGNLIIVDPNANATGVAISYTGTGNYDIPTTSNHTVQFGNGVSTDAGGAIGFDVNMGTTTTSRISSLANVVMATQGGTNRFLAVSTASAGFGIIKDFTIPAGQEVRVTNASSVMYFAGNVVINGTYISLGTTGFGRFTAGASTLNSLNAQTLSLGAGGAIRNTVVAASATGNITNLVVHQNTTLTLQTPLVVTGTLTLTAGRVITDDTNLITHGGYTAGTTTPATTGGTVTVTAGSAWIEGPHRRIFAASTANTTIGQAMIFPIGNSGYYPVYAQPGASVATATLLEGRVFLNANTMAAGPSMLSINTARRWEVRIISGTGTPMFLAVGDAAATASSGIGMGDGSNADGGIYDVPSTTGTTFVANTAPTPNILFLANSLTPTLVGNTVYLGYGNIGPLSVGNVTTLGFNGFVFRNTTNNSMGRITIPVFGFGGGQRLDAMTLNYTGAAISDLTGVTLWTGTATAASTQIGTGTIVGNTITFTGLNRTLTAGLNYFYVRVNTTTTAVFGNLVNFTLPQGGLTFTATAPSDNTGLTAPSVNRDFGTTVRVNYCFPTFTNTCGSSGAAQDFISEVYLNTLNLTGFNCNSVTPFSYYDYTTSANPNYTTTLEVGGTYTLSFTNNPSYSENVGLALDLNGNGTFETTEFFGGGSYAAGATASFPITVDNTAALGVVRLRVLTLYATTITNTNILGCGQNFSYGSIMDFNVTIVPATPKTLATVTTQARNGYLTRSSTNNNMYRLDLGVTGTIGTLNLTQLRMTYNGTPSDLTNVRLFTGTATAAGTQIGTTQTSGSTVTFSGLTQNLTTGTTYLWVRADVSATAVRDNLADFTIAAGDITVSATGGATASGTYPASTLDGTGNYRVWYCAGGDQIGGSANCLFAQRMTSINMVGATSTLNASGVCDVVNGGLFSIFGSNASPAVDIRQGSSYTLNVTPATAGAALGAWIDYNNNLTFETTEYIGTVATTVAGPNAITFAVPFPSAQVGNSLIRVRTFQGNTISNASACTSVGASQTIDIWVSILPPPDCSTATTGTYPAVTTATTTLAGPLCVAGAAALNATFDVPLSPYNNVLYQWQYSPTISGTYSNVGIASSTSAATSLTMNANTGNFAGYYRLVVQCNSNGVGPIVDLSTTNNPVQIQIDNPTATNTTTTTSRCGFGAINVSASTTGTGVKWFTTATGGTAFATTTGSTSTTPVTLTALGNTTVYAEPQGNTAVTSGNVGRGTPATNTTFITTNWGIVFDATSDVTINSVTIYPSGSGTIDVAIRATSGTGTELGSTGSLSVSGDALTPVVLTFPTPVNVPAGTGYRIVVKAYTGLSGLVRETVNPFPINGNGLNITSSEWGGTTTGTYYFFYNVNFTATSTCVGARIPVVLTATTPPAVTITPSASPVCSGTTVLLTANSSAVPAYTYTWGSGATATSAGAPTANAVPQAVAGVGSNVNTTYTVSADNGICNTTASVVVTAQPGPAVTNLQPVTGAELCEGNNLNLSATVAPIPVTAINETFNSGIPSGWTVTNLGQSSSSAAVGTAPTTTLWQAATSGVYSYLSTTYTTPDNSNFVIANSDIGGSGSITKTILTSSAFSTIGNSNMSLSMQHLYTYYSSGSDTVLVQMSTNGTSWTDVAVLNRNTTPGLSYGSPGTTWVTTPGPWSVPAAFNNQATVYIRFYYRSAYGFRWAINGFSITSDPPAGAITTAWTGPESFSTAGTYVAPTASASRTAVTLTQGGNYNIGVTQNGCTTTLTSNIIVNSKPSVNIVTSPDVNDTQICPGDVITMDSQADPVSGTISSIVWRRNSLQVSTGTTNTTYPATSAGIYDVTVTNSKTCTRSQTWTITPVQYAVTTSAGPGGTITPTTNVDCGTNFTVTATPNACQVISAFTVDGVTTVPAVGAAASVTFTDVREIHNVSATFVQRQFVTSYNNIASDGSAYSVSPAIVDGVTTIGCGDPITYTFTAADACDSLISIRLNNILITPVQVGTTNNYTFTFTPSASGGTINATAEAYSFEVRSARKKYRVIPVPYTNNVAGVNGSAVGGGIGGFFTNLVCGNSYTYAINPNLALFYSVSGVQLWNADNTVMIQDYGAVSSVTIPAIDGKYYLRAYFNTTPGFDVPNGAIPLTTATYPSCLNNAQSLAGCKESPQTSTFRVLPTNGNQDGWFRFRVPDFSTGKVVITAAANSMDLGLVLFTDNLGSIVATKNANASITAGEKMIVDLTPGAYYRVAVKNMGTTSASNFTICVNSIRPAGCTSVTTGSLCSTFLGAYTGANSYTFTFTNNAVPTETFTKTVAGGTTVVPMSTVKGLRYGAVYNVAIDATYSINDGATTTTFTVPASGTTCTFSTVPQPATDLAVADRAPTVRYLSSIISTSWVCGVVDYEWRVNSGASVNRGFAERFLRVNQLPGLTSSGVAIPGLYAIDIRPLFSDGTPTGVYAGSWGTQYNLLLAAFANTSATDAVDNLTVVEADRVEHGNGVSTALYPNPNNGDMVYVNVLGVKSDKVQIRVIDAMGRQMLNNQYSVNGSLSTALEFGQTLSSGLYMVEYIFDGEVHTQRLVVTK